MGLTVNTIAVRPAYMPARYAQVFVYLFFFISGVPALIYQLAWQRVLFRIFGLSMDSVTVVVTAFMLGLGFGSLLGSWLSRIKNISPLIAAAVIELTIGFIGLFSISILGYVDPVVQDLTLAERSLAVIGLVFVPTMLMGATLPLLIGYLVKIFANVGFSAGSLYRVNALGAVVGCIIGALLLFPFLGLQATVIVAAALNFLVALTAVFAHSVRQVGLDQTYSRSSWAAAERDMPLQMSGAVALVFASGFVSLSFEIFFLHLASFASASNSVIFTITLAAFILGIASGANDASLWCQRNERTLSPLICRLLLLSAIGGLAVLPLLSISGSLGLGMIAIIELAAFVVARSLGAVFPLATHLSVPPDNAAGYKSGLLYLGNIVGSATGSLLTGFVLCDLFGSRALALILSGLGLSVGLLFALKYGRREARLALLLLAAVSGVLAVAEVPLTGSVFEAMLYQREMRSRPPLTRVVENRYGVVAVSSDGTVFGGGIYDGRFNVDLVHDTNGIIRAYALSLFHPAPSDVFMIGLASGSWAQVIANNPAVRHLTIVEINPAYLSLVRERPEVSSLLKNPKVTLIFDDANRWLKRHPEAHYDAIIANATYHFRANASNLLSVEFDRLIASRLKHGGIYEYNATGSDRVARTGCQSFRYGYRLLNNIVASNDPIKLDEKRWRENLLATRIDGKPVFDMRNAKDKAVLNQILGLPAYANYVETKPEAQPLEPCRSILSRDSAVALITNDNMGTEWRYSLGLD